MDFIAAFFAALFGLSTHSSDVEMDATANQQVDDGFISDTTFNNQLPQSEEVSSWNHLDDDYWLTVPLTQPTGIQITVIPSNEKSVTVIPPNGSDSVDKYAGDIPVVGSSLSEKKALPCPTAKKMRDLTKPYGGRRYYAKDCHNEG